MYKRQGVQQGLSGVGILNYLYYLHLPRHVLYSECGGNVTAIQFINYVGVYNVSAVVSDISSWLRILRISSILQICMCS